MRSRIACVVTLATALMIAGSASAGHGGRMVTRTGDITKLTFSRVSVAGVTCNAPTASSLLDGHFALGEKVTIQCWGRVLRLIRRALGDLAQSSGTGGANGANGSTSSSNVSSNSTSTATSSSNSTQASTDGSSSATAVATSSSTDQSGTTTSTSAEGPITAVTSTSVSIGAATCPYDPSSYPPGSELAQLKVGDVVKINCQTPPSGAPTSSVSLP